MNEQKLTDEQKNDIEHYLRSINEVHDYVDEMENALELYCEKNNISVDIQKTIYAFLKKELKMNNTKDVTK